MKNWQSFLSVNSSDEFLGEGGGGFFIEGWGSRIRSRLCGRVRKRGS